MKKIQNQQRIFAFIVLYGFEIKFFFGSRLYISIAKKNNSFILRRDFLTKNFNEYIKNYNLTEYILSKDIYENTSSKLESLYLASRRARKRLLFGENFNYFKKDRMIKWTDYILGNKYFEMILGLCIPKVIQNIYFNKEVNDLYKKLGITDIVITGYSSMESKIFAHTALKTNKKVYLIVNSWKDFYVNDLLTFTPTKIFVWSHTMKKQILQTNKHIDALSVIVSGNPSFDRFYNYSPIHSKEYYSSKYKFDIHRPILLWSMISPLAYAYEKEVIELVNRQLIEKYPDETKRPVIILRRNPIDETEAKEDFFSGKNVRYADNYFEGSYEHAVFVQLEEGEVEWLDLLCYAKININVASTVTLEALMMQTPVINVEFNKDGAPEEVLMRYSQAPFYKPLLDRKDVAVTDTIEACIQVIMEYLENEIIIESLESVLSHFDGKATERIIKVIENA